MMKVKVFVAAAFFGLLFLVAAESRAVAGGDAASTQRRHDDDDDGDDHHGHHHHDDDDDHHGNNHHHHHDDDDDHHGSKKKKKATHKLFVFGDEFADNGNLGSDPALAAVTSAWRYPYGMSDKDHGRKATGRFSDGLVQSDFLAKIMGHRESPPAYRGDGWEDVVDPAGMNFATGWTRVLQQSPQGVLRLRSQVKQLKDLVSDGVVDEDRDFKKSVALVAYSGNDYGDADCYDSFEEMIPNVVEELASVVSQLQDVGVTKVLVTTLPPFGCSPWQARGMNYTSCNDDGNWGPDRHNAALRERLGDDDDVMLLDVYTVFNDMVSGSPALSAQFKELLQPCCEAYDEDGAYCGHPDGRYWLCERPEEYFYWDFVNPTHAGWRAVMQMLQGPIMAFLGISDLNHF